MLLSALQLDAFAQSKHTALVESVSFAGDAPIRLKIHTSVPLTPEIQVISSPERLIIDLPNSLPGRTLRGFAVNRGEVRSVRTGLYSQSPPITRIVVDLNTPQWYRIVPDASGFLISLGGQTQGAADAQSTVGWVSTRSAASVSKLRAAPAIMRTSSNPVRAPLINGASVRFDNGALSIHATNATLSEVLFQIQKVTGAEIAIPAGTEQQKVAGDFGPGTASEVLSELLNGSGLNFVVVGSDANANLLRSVILSVKDGEADSPAAFAQQVEPAAAQNVDPQTNGDPENTEPIAPVPQQAPPQQPLPPDNGPPADPPPTM